MHKCPHNRRAECWLIYKEITCPYTDERWMEIVQRWALERGPKAATWISSGGTPSITYDDRLVLKANINQLFVNPELILACLDGRTPLTLAVCKDLARAREVWKGVMAGFPRVKESQRVDKKYPLLANIRRVLY